MQVDSGRLKLCVRILGAALKEHDRDVSTSQQSKHRSILPEDVLLKATPYTDLLRRRTFDRLARGDTPEVPSRKQFRIIVPADLSVRELKSLIAIQFRKLYPTEDPLLVRYIREAGVDCDLDDDFLVSDFFTEDSFVVALCETIAEGRMTSAPTHVTACEVIAMPRPLVTPMSEMGDILHKELLSASPTPSMMATSLMPAAVSSTGKEKKRRRRGRASTKETTQDEKPSKKPHIDALPTNGKTKESLVEQQVSCPININELPPSPAPMPASEGGEGAFRTIAESPKESPSGPAAKKSPAKEQTKIRFGEGLQMQAITPSLPTQVERSQSEPLISSSAPATGRMYDEEVISLIQAMPSSSSSDEDEDADLAIPVVESRLTAAPLRPLVGASSIPGSSASGSSEGEDADADADTPQMEAVTTTTGSNAHSVHRTSLTVLTEELRRSSAASPIPPVPTKILAPINANGAGRPRRRRQRRRGESTPGPTAAS